MAVSSYAFIISLQKVYLGKVVSEKIIRNLLLCRCTDMRGLIPCHHVYNVNTTF